MVTCKTNGKSYIGKTKHTLKCRKKQHHSASKCGSNLLFHKAIRKYGRDNFKWEILFESDDDMVLYEKEMEYIETFCVLSPNGYNMTAGGEGYKGVKFPDEWYVKNKERAEKLGKDVYCLETGEVYPSCAEAGRRNGVPSHTVSNCCHSKSHLTYCKLHFCFATEEEIANLKRMKEEGLLEKKQMKSEESIQKMRKSLTGRKMSEEFCKRRREIMLESSPWKGKHLPKEAIEKMRRNRKGKLVGKENPSARKIICVEFDKIYDCIKEAVEDLELPPKAGSNISSCCAGKLRTAYGYHWQYA